MKIYLYLLLKSKRSGFTLIELLMASMMTIFVVMAAGYGTMVMLRENTAASVASDTQYNTNRAADFIADEVKSSSSILTTSPSVLPSGCGTFVFGLNAGLTNPTSGQTNLIIYCLSGTTSDSPWLGKNVINRYGPPLDQNGAYTTGAWTNQVLVDLIAENPQNKTCPIGLTQSPSSGVKGFFACVDSTGKNVEIHLNSSAVDINDSKAQTTAWMKSSTDTENTGRFADKATYEVVTQVYARSQGTVKVTVNGGTATFDQKAEATFAFSSCASTFFPINPAGTTTDFTTTNTSSGSITVILDPSSLSLVPATGSFTVAATANSNVVTFTSGTCVITATLKTP